jgi:hypothetical protein
MNKDDAEFLKLVGSKHSDCGIILIDRKKFLTNQWSYPESELKNANILDKIVTSRIYEIKGCDFLLVYGSSNKEDNEVSLKKIKSILTNYVKDFTALDKIKTGKASVFIYKKFSYSIVDHGRNKLIPMVKLLHESELKNHKMSLAETLMAAYNHSKESASNKPISLSKWKDNWSMLNKLKFLEKATITYKQEGSMLFGNCDMYSNLTFSSD